ncbi:hypothetical protein EI427_23440 [Flammeovirga pectinis]|uniref:Uncharacterized protein n=1 Tax=Flammeovirga pectinis TaxID=2494373 RepID=A0A3S9PAE4_9BACT|nr:hypothetical protein [Flammeovirga pectinis]AZQ65170.1 hypothetical protein EI427_23440 [Flammeovirga pectinis]
MKNHLYIIYILFFVFIAHKNNAQIIELDVNNNIIQIEVNETGVNEFLPSWGGRPWNYAYAVNNIIIKESGFNGDNNLEKQIDFNTKSYKKIDNTVLIQNIDIKIFINYYRWTLQYPDVCERDKLKENESLSDCKLACYNIGPGAGNSSCSSDEWKNLSQTFNINELSSITGAGNLIGVRTIDNLLVNFAEVKLIQNVAYSTNNLTNGCIPTDGDMSDNRGPIFDQYEDLIFTCKVYKIEEDTPKVIPTGLKDKSKIIAPSLFKELEEKYYWVLQKEGSNEVINSSEDLYIDDLNQYTSVYVASENFRSKELFFNTTTTLALSVK